VRQQRAAGADLHVVGVRPDRQHGLPALGPCFPARLDQFGCLGHEINRRDRLLHELGCRVPQRGDCVVDGRMPGDHGDRQAGHQTVDPVEQFQPGHSRQFDIGDEQIPRLGLEAVQGTHGVEFVRHVKAAGRAQYTAHVPADVGIVLNQQNPPALTPRHTDVHSHPCCGQLRVVV
jgi:hypothetical protein